MNSEMEGVLFSLQFSLSRHIFVYLNFLRTFVSPPFVRLLSVVVYLQAKNICRYIYIKHLTVCFILDDEFI
jgi:hypothetical protein